MKAKHGRKRMTYEEQQMYLARFGDPLDRSKITEDDKEAFRKELEAAGFVRTTAAISQWLNTFEKKGYFEHLRCPPSQQQVQQQDNRFDIAIEYGKLKIQAGLCTKENARLRIGYGLYIATLDDMLNSLDEAVKAAEGIYDAMHEVRNKIRGRRDAMVEERNSLDPSFKELGRIIAERMEQKKKMCTTVETNTKATEAVLTGDTKVIYMGTE